MSWKYVMLFVLFALFSLVVKLIKTHKVKEGLLTSDNFNPVDFKKDEFNTSCDEMLTKVGQFSNSAKIYIDSIQKVNDSGVEHKAAMNSNKTLMLAAMKGVVLGGANMVGLSWIKPDPKVDTNIDPLKTDESLIESESVTDATTAWITVNGELNSSIEKWITVVKTVNNDIDEVNNLIDSKNALNTAIVTHGVCIKNATGDADEEGKCEIALQSAETLNTEAKTKFDEQMREAKEKIISASLEVSKSLSEWYKAAKDTTRIADKTNPNIFSLSNTLSNYAKCIGSYGTSILTPDIYKVAGRCYIKLKHGIDPDIKGFEAEYIGRWVNRIFLLEKKLKESPDSQELQQYKLRQETNLNKRVARLVVAALQNG